MECSRCDAPAVLTQRYSGQHLCERHLRESVGSRVTGRIREDGLLASDDETWVVGLSGGKDSSVLLEVLADTFCDDPRVELVALTLDEGIEGYRDDAVRGAERLADELGVRHEVVAFEDEFGVRVDDEVEAHVTGGDAAGDGGDASDGGDADAGGGGKHCAYCGVFRRTALNRHAERLGATKLLTGHNLDDVAQTALMNLLDGDVDRMARHYRASLSPRSEAGQHDDGDGDGHFVRRAKPLRDVPEKEVAVYAQLADLPVHMEECPNAAGATRGHVRDLLLSYEEQHPGTRHSIVSAYEELGERLDWDGADAGGVSPCVDCGEPTPSERCRACAMLDEVA
jgi:uncharacterized protein (TIGR00269 family)